MDMDTSFDGKRGEGIETMKVDSFCLSYWTIVQDYGYD